MNSDGIKDAEPNEGRLEILGWGKWRYSNLL